MKKPRIAIVGAGIGGLTCAIALRQAGVAVTIFEQAPAFGSIGASITLTPNAVKVFDGLGLKEAIREKSHIAAYRISRTWDTGEETSRIELGKSAEKKYGVPPLMLHRADLLNAIVSLIPINIVHFNKKLSSLKLKTDTVELVFEDGTSYQAEAVIGADGIHSEVRNQLFGAEAPKFTGMSAYRTMIPARNAGNYDRVNFVKWWGPSPESQIVTNAIDHGKSLYLFATLPEEREVTESWSTEGSLSDLQDFFSGYHQEARAIIDASGDLFRSAMYERKPLLNWSKEMVTILGDACHAMTPFMAQGAAMGIEDAAILSRCVKVGENWPEIFEHYEKIRKPRTDTIQLNSHKNEWLKKQENPDWVYGFDAWSIDI